MPIPTKLIPTATAILYRVQSNTLIPVYVEVSEERGKEKKGGGCDRKKGKAYSVFLSCFLAFLSRVVGGMMLEEVGLACFA